MLVATSRRNELSATFPIVLLASTVTNAGPLFLVLLAAVIAPIILINLRNRGTTAPDAQTEQNSQTDEAEPGQTNARASFSPLTFVTGAAALVLTVLLLLLVAWFCYAVFRWPAVTRLRDAAQLATLFANLAVTCYAFPAYTRTKHRPFLALGFAALTFAYGALFSIVFAPGRATTAGERLIRGRSGIMQVEKSP